MQNILLTFLGWSSTVTAFFLNISGWLFSANVNQILTLILSFLSIIFIAMKMYDQYLITKKRKQDDNGN